MSVVVALVLGIALVDFLLQNTQSARIEFFSVSGRVPVSVALLAAALAGAAVVVVIGIARMVQLRRGLAVGRPRSSIRRSQRSPRDEAAAKSSTSISGNTGPNHHDG